MTTALVARPVDRRVIGGLLLAAGGVAMFVSQTHLRAVEATMAAAIMRVTDLANARALGPEVIFTHGQHWIGYTIATSCTAALLIAPFFLVGAALLVGRRLGLRRAFLAVGVVSVAVWLVNQVRLLLIGASMQLWGLKTGYGRSHVLAGGVISTVGVTIGVVAFLALMLRERESASSRRGDL